MKNELQNEICQIKLKNELENNTEIDRLKNEMKDIISSFNDERDK